MEFYQVVSVKSGGKRITYCSSETFVDQPTAERWVEWVLEEHGHSIGQVRKMWTEDSPPPDCVFWPH